MNPSGDFSRLTRLRVDRATSGIKVTNCSISLDVTPFAGFYEKMLAFEGAIGVTRADVDKYLVDIQTD